jgi:hypothetical protein
MKRYLVYTGAALLACAVAACSDRRDRDDVTIAAEARQELLDEKVPGVIEITIVGGIATLSGAVPDAKAKAQAEEVVEDVAGVDRVVNNLRTTMAADAPARPGAAMPPNAGARPDALPPSDVGNPMAPEAPAGAPETR